MNSINTMEPLSTDPGSIKAGKRELTRRRNRQAILNAARQCFAEKGFDQVTVRDIIGKTNLASGTFYNYFTDKESIFRAILDDYIQQLEVRIRNLRSSVHKSLEEYIHATYLALFQAIADDPLIYKLAHDNHRAIQDLYDSNLLGQAFQSLEQDLQEAMSQGQIPRLNMNYLLASFFGVAYEMGLTIAQRSPADPKAAASFATALFIGGLKELAGQAKQTI